MNTSDHLTLGKVYSRDSLRTEFGIKAASINNGVFHPSGHDSVWLLITKEKTPDRVQYKNELVGDDLFFEGQLKGGTDKLLINHEGKGLEVLLFYREDRFQHASAGFVYEGPFKYVEHHGSGPATFHFRRVKP